VHRPIVTYLQNSGLLSAKRLRPASRRQGAHFRYRHPCGINSSIEDIYGVEYKPCSEGCKYSGRRRTNDGTVERWLLPRKQRESWRRRSTVWTGRVRRFQNGGRWSQEQLDRSVDPAPLTTSAPPSCLASHFCNGNTVINLQVPWHLRRLTELRLYIPLDTE